MTKARYLFVAMPLAEVLAALHASLVRHSLIETLGDALFPPGNWHQSLSERFWGDSPTLQSRLLQAGDLVTARAVLMRLNRIKGSASHWTFQARGTPVGFTALLAAIRNALSVVGLEDMTGHRPHVTLSYRPPHELPTLWLEPPVEWLIDEFLLVKGRGEGANYHYEVIKSWHLTADPQLRLF